MNDSKDYWALLWRSENHLDGKRERIMWKDGEPLLFHTRREAREYREEHYGYIKTRPDLKAEPHGWKLPKVIRVRVSVERATS